ncbi:MAG: SH3 domain-containing protein [Anaerolineae bacterium]|nr:SH3 domain-containing protein [Anaerolineae bacterium]
MRRFILLLLALLAAMLLMLTPAYAQESETVTAVVQVASLKVRAAPASDSEQLGLLQRGAKVILSGRSEDRYWGYFLFWDKPAWMSLAPEFVSIEGNLESLTVTGVTSSTSTEAALTQGDGTIRLADFAVAPAVPVPGVPFTLRLHLSSAAPLGAFAVAGEMSGQFFLTPVQFLSGAAEHTLETQVTAPAATGWHEVQLALDVDRSVSAGTAQTLNIFVDRARRSLGRLRFVAFSNLNLDSGEADLSWDGDTLSGLNGSLLGLLDLSFGEAHYDAIEPALPSLIRGDLKAGALIAVITGTQARALLWVREVDQADLVLEVFVYDH